MKRTQMYLTENQTILLNKKAQEVGISKSELIRRILDNYINKELILKE